MLGRASQDDLERNEMMQFALLGEEREGNVETTVVSRCLAILCLFRTPQA